MRTRPGTFFGSETFEALAGNIPIGIALVDPHGKYRYLNPRFTEMFGYDLSEIPDGKTWFEKAYPDEEYREIAKNAWTRDFELSRSGERKPWVFSVVCKDSSTKTIHFIPVQLDSGGTLIAYEDMTERRETEMELTESEQRYRNMFDNIPFPTFVYDLDTLRIVDVNTFTVRSYGYTREEMLNMHLKDLAPDGDVAALLAHPSTTGASQEKVPLRHRKKDGTVIDVEINGHALEFPGKNYRIFCANDITEIRKASVALKFTQFAVDRAAVGILWISENSEIVYGNNEICRLLGYTRQELTRLKIADLDANNPEQFWIEKSKRAPDHEAGGFETVLRTKAGDLFPAEIAGNYMECEGGGYACSIIQNITSRKIIEESLKRREVELKLESNRLQEANTALKVLLKHLDDDRKELGGKLTANIKELVLPYIDKMKRGRLHPEQISYVDIVETNLNDILSPFLQKMSVKYANFTSTEIQVANLIKAGKTSKEIADIMNVSTGTIDTHRNNIRAKLNLNRKKINLRTYLNSLG